MADLENTTAGEEGAGVTTKVQDTTQAPQGDEQGQNSPQGSQVVNPDTVASSAGSKPSKSNSAWATERIVEKAIKRHLENSLTPLIEKINALQSPAAPQTTENRSSVPDPDYNNLNQWLNTAVETLLQQKLKQSLPQIKNEMSGELKNQSKTQEARNYLLSQEDIGESEDNLSEIEQIMKRELLDYAAVSQPLKAIKKAVEIWRREKKNPAAPLKEHLSTLPGGMVNRNKKEPSIQQLKTLQTKLASGLPVDEQEKVVAEIASILSLIPA